MLRDTIARAEEIEMQQGQSVRCTSVEVDINLVGTPQYF